MRQAIRQAVVLLGAFVLAGCATQASNTPPGQADYGPRPTNPDAALFGYLNASLKDPGSAIVQRYAGPAKFHRAANLLGGEIAGWGACYAVNAKNSFGGYGGARPLMVVIRNDRVIETIGNIDYPFESSAMKAFCGSADAKSGNVELLKAKAAARLSPASLSELRPGVTTREQAEKMLGRPASQSSFGTTTLLQWMDYEPPGGAHVAIEFDASGPQLMRRVTHSFFQGR